ncbi:MAG: hypothetical protein IJK58_09075 [Clostridia bacterium]|nr:hypothetical protein [Clostridia bacterium]
MLDKLVWKSFADIDISDRFFDSLKADYVGFNKWFSEKQRKKERALILENSTGIHAFLYLKEEFESIKTITYVIPAKERIKIGTFKLDDTISNQRLGEGLVGVSLWKWQESKAEEIYVTVFEKQEKLIGLLTKFGFRLLGRKENGELVLGRSRLDIDYSNAYTSFPFISPKTKKAGLIPINDYFHDRLFPYSETVYTSYEVEEVTAGNGITKVYIGSPFTVTHYSEGDIVVIYRKYTGEGSKGNKSAVTSFCIITKITVVKRDNRIMIPYEQFLKEAGNKTVFTPEELKSVYENANVVMIEMTYNGFFNKGHNVTYWNLKNRGLFEEYPYNITYSLDQMKHILKMGGKDVNNIIVC